MALTCPECKNELAGDAYQNLEHEHMLECNMCGISLQYRTKNNNDEDLEEPELEIVDEGK